MDGGTPAQQVAGALRALADLSPSSVRRASQLTISTEWFRWLDVDSVRLFDPIRPAGGRHLAAAMKPPRFTELADDRLVKYASVDRRFGERLAAVDQIRPESRSLRVGWLFVAGRTDVGGRPRRVFHPLVTVPVRVDRLPGLGDARLTAAGDIELSELVVDDSERQRLERGFQDGGGALYDTKNPIIPGNLLSRLEKLQRFAQETAAAAELAATTVIPAAEGPDQLMRRDGLVIVAGVGVFATHDTGTASRAGSLRAWASEDLSVPTAFHSLYTDAIPEEHVQERHRVVDSPFVLNEAQREAVLDSRTADITLISGAPGTGKSHTIVAIACDALARGQSVLVAAKSDATVDALLDLFERAPGLDPVVFGSNERREELASRLSAGQLKPESSDKVRRLEQERDRRVAAARSTRDAINAHLLAEQMLDEGSLAAPQLRSGDAGLIGERADLDDIEARIDPLMRQPGSWWSRWRHGRRVRRLLADLSVPAATSLREVRDGVRAARAREIAEDLITRGGLELGPQWDKLVAEEALAREAVANWLAAEARSDKRLGRGTLPAIAILATALRSGRAARRSQLSRLDERLTHALPIWVGSLPDIDDLLPAVPALFDLVILDEASSLDQPMSAPALLRGRRAVVAGDPKQLRHVSFLSSDQIESVIETHGFRLDPLVAARLDVRRNSAFDVAAAVTPVLTLDEHFRCDPHLMDYVATHLYGGSVKVATRAPSTQSRDCISVVRLDGTRNGDGVVESEVEWIIGELRRLRSRDVGGVGVVTPFRAQADALEEAILRNFEIDDLEALDLRVGTVHAFQGNERDHLLVSLGLGPEETGTSWRFVEDPHLFAVLATRARRQMTIVACAEPPASGLLAGYLAQADAPPAAPSPSPPISSWVRDIADDLRSSGLEITTGYPVGHHVIDIVAHRGDVAIECTIHPDGADAHVERHVALHRSGWRILDAYPSRWGERRGELVVELLQAI